MMSMIRARQAGLVGRALLWHSRRAMAMFTPVADMTNTLGEMQQRACETYGDRPLFGFKTRDGSDGITWMSYREFAMSVQRCSIALHQAGIGVGDKVAVISNNRVEWAITAYATFGLGGVVVPMYEQQRLGDIDFILRDSEAKLVLVGSESVLDKTRSLTKNIETLVGVWCFDYDWKSRLDTCSTLRVQVPRPEISSDHVCAIIYTSGTSGQPKGCLLTHKNILSNLRAMNEVVPLDALEEVISVSFLPWAHCIGLNCELQNLLQRGGSIYISSGLEHLAQEIKEVRPTCLFSVPTLFTRIHQKITEKLASEPLSRVLVETALEVSERRRRVLQSGGTPSVGLELEHRLLDRLVLAKLREPLGGRLAVAPVGGSALDPTIHAFFENVGIAILQGYGLTETSPLLSIGRYDIKRRRVGTVGEMVKGAEIAIVDVTTGERVQAGAEGEIWARGDSVFGGYHKRPADTDAVFGMLDGHRWFKTGDLGTLKEGSLSITGRIKEIFKLENGKYVVPGVVEQVILRAGDGIIAQAMVLGGNRPYTTALLVPAWDKVRAWAVAQGVLPACASLEQLRDSPEVNAYIGETIAKACQTQIKKYEVPRKWALLVEPFSTQNGQLTPKMSLRRHVVHETYSVLIDNMYSPDTCTRKTSPWSSITEPQRPVEMAV